MKLTKPEPSPAWHIPAQRQRLGAGGRAGAPSGSPGTAAGHRARAAVGCERAKTGRKKPNLEGEGSIQARAEVLQAASRRRAAEQRRDEGVGAGAAAGGTVRGTAWLLPRPVWPRLAERSRTQRGHRAPPPAPTAPTGLPQRSPGVAARAAPLPRPGTGDLPCGGRSGPVPSGLSRSGEEGGEGLFLGERVFT